MSFFFGKDKNVEQILGIVSRIECQLTNGFRGVFSDLKEIKELLKKPPTPPSDPFDNVFLKVRVGGNTFYFKLGDRINMANFTVADDHVDVPFSVAPVTGAKDVEGEDIPADGITTTPAASDNEAAVSIVDVPESTNPDTGEVTPAGKALHFGAPGVAHVAVDSSYQGNVIKHSEATILVTTGTLDPNSVQGGDLVIPGLTPDA